MAGYRSDIHRKNLGTPMTAGDSNRFGVFGEAYADVAEQ